MTKMFTLDTSEGHSIPGATYSRLVLAKTRAAALSKSTGREITVSERKDDWSFIVMRGIASNGSYTRIIK